jgi:methionyl-tRNA synthetase
MADELAALPPGHPIAVPEVLFAKVTDDQKAELEARFGGPDS